MKGDKRENKKEKNKVAKPGSDFQLLKAIQGKPQKNNRGEAILYKSNVRERDKKVRKFIDEALDPQNNRTAIPGQLVMFNYFEPATKEDLKYYDAMPCTIFFGIVKTQNGPRVLGFNIHYYPPRIRYQLMDRIFDIFKPFYLKSWDDPLKAEITDFSYKMLMRQLQKAKLDFGVRMYIPNLMHKITPIPPMYWQKAVFTEGKFKKETRTQILNYWRNKELWKEKKESIF